MTTALSGTVYPSQTLGENPYEFYGFLLEDAPVYKVPGRNEYLVSRYEDIVYVLRHPEIFSNVKGKVPVEGQEPVTAFAPQASMIATDPPEHAAKRKLCFEGFKPGRLRAAEPRIEAIVDELIDRFIDRKSVELVAEFAVPLPILVFCALFFGDARRDYDRFLRLSGHAGSGTAYLAPEARAEEAQRIEGLSEYLQAAIRDRYTNPRDDVLSDMIRMQVERDGSLDVQYLEAEAAVLLGGGLSTTAKMIASTMLLLIEHPEHMKRVRADVTLIKPTLDESLRLESPVQWNARGALVDTEIGGVSIPAGSKVIVVFGAANRDSRKFEHACKFDSDRSNVAAHLAFGSGPHTCLGAPLARLEGTVAFRRLFARLGDISLADHPDGIRHIESPEYRGLAALHLAFTGSNPA